MEIERIIVWLTNNWELVSAVIVALLGLVGSTKWGAAHREALDMVTEAVELTEMKNGRVKLRVTKKRGLKSAMVNRMLERSINKARRKYLNRRPVWPPGP